MDSNFGLFDHLKAMGELVRSELNEEVTIEERNEIPDVATIKLEVPRWYRVDDVVAVVARFYEAYMQPLIRTVRAFEPAFLDIQGDGLVAIFDGDDRYGRAFCAGETMRTFSEQQLLPELGKKLTNLPATGLKVGMASGAVFVKRVGVRGEHNEPIWAGRPVNYAAKCAQAADAHQVVVTRAVWEHISSNDYIRMSCGCPSGFPRALWSEMEVDRLPAGHQSCWTMTPAWCNTHGEEFCRAILAGKTKRAELAA